MATVLELRKCRSCEKYLTLDQFERKTVCRACTEKKREEREESEATPQETYIVVCEVCRQKIDANKVPWICGKCINCWPPSGTKARQELEKIWRKVNGRS